LRIIGIIPQNFGAQRSHNRPAVAEAVQTIRTRFPRAEVNVWVNAGGTITQIAIRARFDGVVGWYWVLGERSGRAGYTTTISGYITGGGADEGGGPRFIMR